MLVRMATWSGDDEFDPTLYSGTAGIMLALIEGYRPVIHPGTFRNQHGKSPEHANRPSRARQTSVIRRPGRFA